MSSMTALRPFHLAFPVEDLEEARRFFCELLGCKLGRTSDRWMDFNFFGHQISAHLVDATDGAAVNAVDGDAVPVRHFGLILTLDEWRALRAKLESSSAEFIIEPKVRFEGQPGEQATMFVKGPSRNAIEFKAFDDAQRIFER